jgi:dTDP-4-dehydrorhamnose reductase
MAPWRPGDPMKGVVIGANGQLGSDILEVFVQARHTMEGLNHDVLDISHFEGAYQLLQEIRPEYVINTAAMHQVEACEKDPVRSFQVNGLGARNLALLSRDLGFTLVHVSTDYVFDGKLRRPYLETDPPLPLNVYGNTKLAGEFFICSLATRYYIVRVSGLYGSRPCRAKGGLNFVRLMLKLARGKGEVRVVDDEFVTPTYTRDVASQLLQLLPSGFFGTYHMTAQGFCSWYEFAEKIFEFSKTPATLLKAAPGQFPAKVPRPSWSVLENRALQEHGLDRMPHWTQGLQSFLDEINELRV